MSITRRFRALRFLRPNRQHRRGEVRDLLSAPTDALGRIRRKADAGRVLSRAEWMVVAYLAQHAMETVAMTDPTRLSTDSLITVLDAFGAVYDMHTERDLRRDPYYLGNLPVECRPALADEAPTSEAVRTAVAETRRRLRQRDPRCFPWLAARNLGVLLAEDLLPRAAVVHRALRPHWPALWRLAVQGHDALTGVALPDLPASRDASARNDRRL